MINHKYNISEQEIVSVTDETSHKLIELPEEVNLGSNYRIGWNGQRVTCASGQSTHPVTVRTTHSQTTASTTANEPVLSAPAQHAAVASKKDEKKHK